MSIVKLRRVLWRLQEIKPAAAGLYGNKELRLAIMEECGTDERTIDATIKKLIELKMIAHAEFGKIKITLNR